MPLHTLYIFLRVQVTLMNKDNQSYLVVFDGSLLISEMVHLLTLCQKYIVNEDLR